MKALMVILFIVALLGVAFLFSVGLTWVICWAFGLQFSWKIAVGVWILVIILKSIFGARK